jgi:hypothetical protein
MATLQIRDLPDPLHQLHIDLQQASGGDPRERGGRSYDHI